MLGQGVVADEPRDIITEEQRGELEDVFKALDFDGDGVISVRDFKKALRSIGLEANKKEILKMFADAQIGATKVLTCAAFIRLMTRRKQATTIDQDMERAYRAFARAPEGMVAGDIRRVAGELGEILTDEEVAAIVEEVDRDQDGCVSYDDFCNAMRRAGLF